MPMSREYVVEKVEAFNVAIEALRNHEPMSDGNHELAARLRERLAKKLENELERWLAEHGHHLRTGVEG